MITDAILTVLFSPIALLNGLIPSFGWPSWLTEDFPNLGLTLGQHIEKFRFWIDIGLLMTVISFAIPLQGISLTINVGRKLVSLLTGGGGA